MYDQEATQEITLCNTGLVGFEFIGLDMDPEMGTKPKPGVPALIPHRVSNYMSMKNISDSCQHYLVMRIQ